MIFKGKTYKLVPVESFIKNGEIDHNCNGCAFEHEPFGDTEGGCYNVGEGCIEPGVFAVWQEEQSQ